MKRGGLIISNTYERPRFLLGKKVRQKSRIPRKFRFFPCNHTRKLRKKRFELQWVQWSTPYSQIFDNLSDIIMCNLEEGTCRKKESKVKKLRGKFRCHGYFFTVLCEVESTLRQTYYEYHEWKDEQWFLIESRESRKQALSKWGLFWKKYAKKRPLKKFKIRWQRLPKWLFKINRPRWRRFACPLGKFPMKNYPMWPSTQISYPLLDTFLRLRYWGNSNLTKFVGEELRIAKKIRTLQERHILKNV